MEPRLPRKFTLAMEELRSYYTLICAGGRLTNYGQIAMDVADRSRFRNPMGPPAFAPAEALGELLLRFVE